MLDLNNNLINALNAYFSTNGFLNLHANMKDVSKNNVVLHGIKVADSNKKQSLVYYLKEHDDDVINLARKLIKNVQEMKKFNQDEILSAEYIKAHVKPRLVAAETDGKENPILTDKAAFPLDFLDMKTIYYVDLGVDGNGNATIPVTEKLLETVGLNIYDIDLYAFNNINNQIEYMSMFRKIAEMQGFSIEEESPFDDDMFILTTKNMLHGAAAMQSRDIMHEIHEKIGCNFYILPSSTHEVIIVADHSNEPNAKKIETFYNMVREANDTQVEPEDRLTYSVYYYSDENGLEIAA